MEYLTEDKKRAQQFTAMNFKTNRLIWCVMSELDKENLAGWNHIFKEISCVWEIKCNILEIQQCLSLYLYIF